MPVNLSPPTELSAVAGVELSSVAAGLRYQGRNDLVLMRLAEGSTVSAVFTQNKCCAAPVWVAREHLRDGRVQALLINAGNANAVTGEQGMNNARQCCEYVAQQLGLDATQVMPFSTGVIGEQLPMSAMYEGIADAASQLSELGWLDAAEAIMTTDTVPKAMSKTVEIAGNTVSITGISKGSGMICPNMATMLAYVVTDAELTQLDLDALLARGVSQSFNRITVDSDTSTNDALVLAATGQSANITSKEDLEQFYQTLQEVLIFLATAIVRDGEGATKLIKITVSHGHTEADCRQIAYDVAHSPLVKTALFASDPNWGRILMAVGKTAANSLDMDRLEIRIGGVKLIERGQPANNYTEEQGQAVFSQAEVNIDIQLNTGTEAYHVWTSDLSHDYVSINADYRS